MYYVKNVIYYNKGFNAHNFFSAEIQLPLINILPIYNNIIHTYTSIFDGAKNNKTKPETSNFKN